MTPKTAPRVLLVEDSRLNQEIVRRQLVALGCVVDVVADGGAAIAACAGGSFDLVLMDLELPVMDGFEATVAIREARAADSRRLPIIALTGHNPATLAGRVTAAGMDGTLTKPIRLEALSETLARQVDPL